MNKDKKTIKKNIVKQSYKFLTLLLAFVSASALWYFNVSPYWEEGYTGYITLFLVGILFCVIYWFFAKMYQAQKIGIYRLTELTYFQMLAFFLADAILVVETIIWFHGMGKIHVTSYLIGFVLQMMAQILAVSDFARFSIASKYQ